MRPSRLVDMGVARTFQTVRLLPDLALPAAIALGAVVAPPDAVAATAVARRTGLPRRLVTLLEGEGDEPGAGDKSLRPTGGGGGDA